MKGLCDALDEYGMEIRADFQQFYAGLDITDVWKGKLTVTRAIDLLEMLAYVPDSRYRAAALGTSDFIGWDRVASQLAEIIDGLQTNTVVTAKAAGGKPKQPDPYKRPEVVEKDSPMPPERELTIDNFPIMLMVAAMGLQPKKK
jgi:hypothetical protein